MVLTQQSINYDPGNKTINSDDPVSGAIEGNEVTINQTKGVRHTVLL